MCSNLIFRVVLKKRKKDIRYQVHYVSADPDIDGFHVVPGRKNKQGTVQ